MSTVAQHDTSSWWAKAHHTFGGSLSHRSRGGSIDKPTNGLAGLVHWRYDLRSGFMVALISLPFSMGIAITSGAPLYAASFRQSLPVFCFHSLAART